MHVCKAYYRQVELRADLLAVRTPTLVLAGADDAVVPPAATKRVAATLPRAHFALVPHTSHQLMMEAPDEVNGHMLAFLERGALPDSPGRRGSGPSLEQRLLAVADRADERRAGARMEFQAARGRPRGAD